MSEKAFPEYAAEIYRDPFAKFKSYIDQGRKVMGYTCSYVPEEILYAAGFIPFRILGRATSFQKADRYLQTYCCSQVRGLMEDFENGKYQGISGLVFSHTCDSMQPFHDIFRKAYKDLFVHAVNLPSKMEGDVPFKYAVAEINVFRKKVEDFSGTKITPEALKDAVAVYNENRTLLDKLYRLHIAHPGKIPSVTLMHAVVASVNSDKRETNKVLAGYLAQFDEKAPADKSKKKIVIVGNININEEIYNLADEFGAIVADDDLCTGRRYFECTTKEPTVEGIVKRFFEKPICAAKHRGLHTRDTYITNLAKKHEAAGVLFLYLKFCDPHCFDYPYIKEALDNAGFKSQFFEVETSLMPSGQIRTKLQAFMEMLG